MTGCSRLLGPGCDIIRIQGCRVVWALTCSGLIATNSDDPWLVTGAAIFNLGVIWVKGVLQ